MTNELFSDALSKRAALDQLFETLPEITLLGVVGARGPSGGKIGQQTLWSATVELVAWRQEGGPIQRTLLRLVKTVTDQEIKELRQKISCESLIRFRAKLALQNPFDSPHAQLTSLLGAAQDFELMEVLHEYQKPITFHDTLFGIFTLDKRINWLETKAEWCGRTISLYASIENLSGADAAVQTAHELWKKMPEWDRRIKEYAVAHLLELKNDNWLGDNEAEVSAHEFTQRMELTSITVSSDRSFEFMHDDGDLFWGHCIQVCGTLASGPNSAGIPG